VCLRISPISFINLAYFFILKILNSLKLLIKELLIPVAVRIYGKIDKYLCNYKEIRYKIAFL